MATAARRSAPLASELVVDPATVGAARAAALPDEVVDDVVETFKVLANGTRIRVLRALTAGELCVGDLASLVGLSVSAVSHQLQALRRAGIVTSRSAGKRTYYRLRDCFATRLLTDCLADRR